MKSKNSKDSKFTRRVPEGAGCFLWVPFMVFIVLVVVFCIFKRAY